MSACIYVCMFICITCMYIYIHTYTYVCVCAYLYVLHVCTYTYMYVYIHVIHTNIHTYMHADIHTLIYTYIFYMYYMYVHIHTYMYKHAIHINTHTRTHTHTHTRKCQGLPKSHPKKYIAIQLVETSCFTAFSYNYRQSSIILHEKKNSKKKHNGQACRDTLAHIHNSNTHV
jgi:hypothetical protein